VNDRPRPNLILTGFMGTGKTTVGRIVAERLGFEFIDTDALIEDRHGPIATIFAEQGEPAFRAIERELASELGQRGGLIISTGGAMMLDGANVEALSGTGTICCLVADAEEIHRRVTADAGRVERPLLTVPDPRARIEELLAERAAGYRSFHQVDTTGRTPEDLATEVTALLTLQT